MATTWMVDNDGLASPGNCNGGGSVRSTIQGAVNAASDGDTILVCPGVYKEQVTVVGYSDLTIKSIVPFGATIRTPKHLHEPYLVGIGLSQNVTFQGFRLLVLAKDTGCQELEFGILTSEATGIVIRGNRIQTTGAKTLTGPCGYVIGIQVGDPSGFVTSSAGVAHSWGTSTAGPTPPSRAAVAYNLVANFKLVGISVTGKGANANVLHNSVHFFHVKDPLDPSSCSGPFAASGIAAIGARVVGVSGVGASCNGMGILQADRAGGEISSNAVLSGLDSFFTPSDQTPILLAGILQWDQRHTAGKSDVENNQVFRSIAGIILLNGDGSHLAGNQIWDTGVGVFLHQTQGVTVEDNASNHNGVGIGVNDEPLFGSGGPDDFGRTSSGNVIQNNNARHRAPGLLSTDWTSWLLTGMPAPRFPPARLMR